MTKGSSFANWLNKKTTSSLDTNKNNPSNSQSSVYNEESGPGILARFLPDGETDPNGAGGAAATFLHKDIVTPNQIYSLDNIYYPRSDISQLLAVAISPNQLGPNFTKARKDSSWGWGVFYPHDANALDLRATPYWDNKKNMIDKKEPLGFKAPASYFDSSQQKFFPDTINDDGSEQKGSGNDWLYIGNPMAYETDTKNRYGLGTGIHVDNSYSDVSYCGWTQQFSWPNQSGLDKNWLRKDAFTGYFGEVDYGLKADDTWNDFVDVMTDAVTDQFGHKIGEKGSDGNLIPQGYLDAATPWVNNPKDLINLQNSLYLNRAKYMTDNDGLAKNYWGWNEIPSLNGYWNEEDNIKGTIVSLPLDFEANKLSTKSEWNKIKGDIKRQISEHKSNISVDGGLFDLTYLINNKPIAFAQTLTRDYNNELYEMSYVSNATALKGNGFEINSDGILNIL